MIPQNFEYSSPSTLQEALSLLAGASAKPLAGGMSLIPLMKLRLAAPDHVVDLSRIPDLRFISEQGDSIRIGATTTHYEIESSPVLRARCPLLAETAANIGDVQVRNQGTIGGSVAHADPAADYPAALMALEAQVHVVGAHSDRTVPISDFIVDAMTTTLEPGEIVMELIVPAESSATGVGYGKMVQPASGFAIVGAAARVRMAAGKITFARVGITGLAAHAYRATAVESLLEGTGGTAPDIQRAASKAADGVEANSDLYASATYRSQMARVYTARAVTRALARTS